jgi:acyl transferase domain-containing protein
MGRWAPSDFRRQQDDKPMTVERKEWIMPESSNGERRTTDSPDQTKIVEYLRDAMVELAQTRQRLSEAESRFSEPIAIVGMACRYPGGVRSPDDLWELVASGRDAISDLPEDRGWDLESLGSVGSDGPALSFKGGFIEDACDFDPEFFGIGKEEAAVMDPQQRLLLETSWEACEDAGIDPRALRGSDTSVFMGISVQGYGLWLLGAVRESPQGYYSSGNAASMTSGRIAHVLKLKGPALTIDTACSSSAVALHVACQSLRQRDCSMAIAGGAAIIGTPWLYLEFSRHESFAFAADGRCKSFADSADGTGFAEGVGVVLLERLSDAQRLGHEVLAVVRGSASNQDGESNGLTAPNGLAHENVIRQALSNAGVSAAQVDAVEGHGMGTALGDPIEVQALIATYGRDRDPDRPLWLGSLKSNTGHTQSASGVGGVIKMVMAMRHGLLPKTLHVDQPSRHVDWQRGGVSLIIEPVPWVRNGDLRRAGIHSFGMSGTNVHIILEEPESIAPPDHHHSSKTRVPAVSDIAVPWLLSASGDRALCLQACRLTEFLAQRLELDIADIGYTLAVSRPGHSHRAFVTGTTREQLLAGIERIVDGELNNGIATSGRQVAFAFTGSSAPPIELAASLMRSQPAFASEIERVDQIVSGQLDCSLLDALRAPSTQLEHSHTLMALSFAISAGLAALVKARGVTPSVVVGHGPGEIVAAYVAGALTLEDAMNIILCDAPQSPTIQPVADPELWLTSINGSVDAWALDCEHWSKALNDTPSLDARIPAPLADSGSAFIHIGTDSLPSNALSDDTLLVSAIASSHDDREGIANCLGQLWAAGVAVDWRAFFFQLAAKPVRLPTYAFDRRRYWIDRGPLFDPDGPIATLRREVGDSPALITPPSTAAHRSGSGA